MTEPTTQRVGEDADFSTSATAEMYAAATAPAVKPPAWSGKKTAVAAALALGVATLGAAAAAAALPQGTGSSTGRFDHGGPGAHLGRSGQFGPGQPPQGGPGMPGQIIPGQGVPPSQSGLGQGTGSAATGTARTT